MSTLRIRLLGAPQFKVDGNLLNLHRRKNDALLAYLAVTGQPQHRAHLASLFWPDTTTSRAFANLRTHLSALRQTIGTDRLCTAEDIAWLAPEHIRLDVADFRQSLATTQAGAQGDADVDQTARTKAVALYTGAFMDGFSLADCAAFDEWQFFLREELHQLFMGALSRLVHHARAAGKLDDATKYAYRLVTHDPLDEEVHRTLMQLYAQRGQWAAARRQYESCRHMLETELGVAPAAETTALFAKVTARTVDLPQPAAGEQAVVTPQPPATLDNLPAPLGPIIGRARELTELTALLADPTVRLVTVVGPGGIGKTRLALAAAARQRPRFRDGICYVELASLDEPRRLASVIAHTLALPPAPGLSPIQQTIDFLRDRSLLLILDNFEHLLPAAKTLLTLLEAATSLTILCTSRSRLALQIEQLYPVHGLIVPARDASLSAIRQTDAVRLFVKQARRTHPVFALDESNADQVAAICRAVQGMPLALILAAAWSDLLPLAQIEQRVTSGIDFLAADLHDLPSRQRSLRTVFDSTWDMLTPREQAAFPRLALFRGGFTVDAAAAVADIALRDLRSLMGKSLITRATNDRFEIHELLRQYAHARLAHAPDELAHSRQLHATYFINFLAEHYPAFKGPGHLGAVAALRHDQDNLRVAWQWAHGHQQLALLQQALDGLCLYYHFRGQTDTGIESCQQLAALIRRTEFDAEERDSLLLARTLLWQGIFSRDQGTIDVAEQLWGQSAQLLDKLPAHTPAVRHTYAELSLQQGIAAVRACEYAQAHTHYTQAEQQLRALDNRWELGQVLLEHGLVYWHWNRYDEGRRLCAEGMEIFQELGDQTGVSDAWMGIGLCASGQGLLDVAESALRRCVDVAERGSANRIYVMTARNILGWVLALAGEFPEALAVTDGVIEFADRVGNRYWASMYRWTRGLVQLNLGIYAAARARLAEGIALAQAIDYRRGTGCILMVQAWLAMVDEDFSSAEQMLLDSIPLMREIGHADELAQSLASLAMIKLLQGETTAAWPDLLEGLTTARASNAYLAWVTCLPAAALAAAATGQPGTALRLHHVALNEAYFGKSHWYADVVYPRLIDATITLTPEEQEAARSAAALLTPAMAIEDFLTKMGTPVDASIPAAGEWPREVQS